MYIKKQKKFNHIDSTYLISNTKSNKFCIHIYLSKYLPQVNLEFFYVKKK
jgi:hypothetical protein